MTTEQDNRLTASADADRDARLTVAAPAEATASSASRTIAGLALTWGEPGRTSRGKVIVRDADAIRLPADLTRVKLLHGHRHEGGRAVGHLTASTPTEDGLLMSFQLGTGDAADAALTAAAEHVDDGLSVELVDVKIRGGDLVAGSLQAVALVPVPAFTGARVASVTASDSHTLDAADDDTVAPDLGPGDADDGEDQDDADNTAGAALVDAGAALGRAGRALASPTVDASAQDNPQLTEQEQHMPKNLQNLNASAAVPNSIGAGSSTRNLDTLTASTVAEVLAAARRGDQMGDELSAALVDITHTPMLDAAQPGWLGRVWDGRTYDRTMIDLVTTRPLTAFKMAGFRIVDSPGVDDWAGDKAEIPSFPMSTEAVDVTATKIAGGNDIAREWVDFNHTEMIAAYWQAMADSYALHTDQMIATDIVAAASSAGTATDAIRAAATGAATIETATNGPANYVIMHPTTRLGLLDMTRFDEPAFLSTFGNLADPSNWRSSPLVPEDQVIVGQSSALAFYELPGSPIRVNAVDIARGGYDYAMFGYAATFLRDSRGIVSVTIAPGTP